jgi:hypothetical protein
MITIFTLNSRVIRAESTDIVMINSVTIPPKHVMLLLADDSLIKRDGALMTQYLLNNTEQEITVNPHVRIKNVRPRPSTAFDLAYHQNNLIINEGEVIAHGVLIEEKDFRQVDSK